MSAPGELTVRDVCELLGVKPGTVRSWISRGHIARTKRGGIDGPSLAAYLANETTRPSGVALSGTDERLPGS